MKSPNVGVRELSRWLPPSVVFSLWCMELQVLPSAATRKGTGMTELHEMAFQAPILTLSWSSWFRPMLRFCRRPKHKSWCVSTTLKVTQQESGRQENWPSVSQVLIRSFSSLSHEPLCSATHEKANACVSSNFSLVLSSPFLNCCLGREWFLLPWSCQKKMNYSLLCQNCFHHPQFHSFLIVFLTHANFSTWYHSKGKDSTRVWALRLPWRSWVVQLPKAWYLKDTRDRGEEMIFTKLSWLFLGDIQWKRCKVKPSTLEAQLPLIRPFSASDQPTTSACQGCLPKLPNYPPSHTCQS